MTKKATCPSHGPCFFFHRFHHHDVVLVLLVALKYEVQKKESLRITYFLLDVQHRYSSQLLSVSLNDRLWASTWLRIVTMILSWFSAYKFTLLFFFLSVFLNSFQNLSALNSLNSSFTLSSYCWNPHTIIVPFSSFYTFQFLTLFLSHFPFSFWTFSLNIC